VKSRSVFVISLAALAALAGPSCGGGSDGGSSKGGSGATDGGGSGGGNGCGAGEKNCSGKCVSTTDPKTGCAATDCSPCGDTHGQPSCTAGACTIACDTGFGDCDTDSTNGCEASLDTNQACGGCLIPCASGNTCMSGSCQGPCGNGTIDPGEECDDGNALNLDGCDSSCRYELVLRTTALEIAVGSAPTQCTPTTNRFGQIFPASVVDLLNDDLKGSIDTGSVNVLVQLVGLDDLTGANDSSLSIGILSGDLDTRHPGAWTTGAIDYWFKASADTIDAKGKPIALVADAKIQSSALSIDTPTLLLPFAGNSLELTSAHLRADIDATPSPDIPASPPEKLASGLVVLRSFTANTGSNGLCGNTTVASLAKVPLPKTFTPGGLAACVNPSSVTCLSPPTTGSHVYQWCGEHCGNPGDSDYDANGCTNCAPANCNSNPVDATCNSLLDAIVGGCIVNPPDCVVAFTPTQPDIGSGGNPAVTLTNDPAKNNKVAITVATDAYSAYFKLAANRAHLTNNLP
jgi:hypothetical protein